MDIRKSTKIIAAAIIAFVAIFSIISWATLPVTSHVVQQKQLNDLYSSNYMMTSNYTEVNLSELGQSVSVRTSFNTAVSPWYSNESIQGTLYVVKTHQNMSFPFTDTEVGITNISVYANGINLGFKVEHISSEYLYNSTQVVSYRGPFYNVPALNSINLTITYFVQIVLISGIYHFVGEKKLISTNLTVP